MREILFRGKKKRDERWVEGFLLQIGSLTKETFIVDELSYFEGGTLYDFTEVLPETVGQFTGLLDADGKKIFEGDILRERNGEDIGFIRYDDEDGMFDLVVDIVLYDFSTCNSKWYEVIGNIHDNPELVEVAR